MAKITTTKTTVKTSNKKSSSGGTRPCNICHGTGCVPKSTKKKGK